VGQALPDPGCVGHTTPVRGFCYLAVSGPSMEPTLHPGDWIVARRDGRAARGDVVVLKHPRRPGLLIVKRVAEIREGGFWVLGDAAGASTDSRDFGVVPAVVGRVVWRIRPWGRVR
jgi:nickel-type superoxide dismutase maturation protease